MFNQISPQFVYMIQKEKERELERKIEFARIAREQGTLEELPGWFAQAAQWVNTMILHRAPARQPEMAAEPCCEGVPC